jgi:hypothetical protein
MQTQEHESSRPLHINFDLHTLGDLRFKKELISLLLVNMQELQRAWKTAVETNEESIFKLTAHKVKPTLLILDDQEFSNLIDELITKMSDIKLNLQFNNVCASVIKSLEAARQQ